MFSIAVDSPLKRWSIVQKIPTPNSLNAVAYGAGTWVAVGMSYSEHATVLRSTNGTDWVPVDSGIARNLYGVAYGTGGFVTVGDAVGEEAVVMTSSDGQTWQRQSSAVTNALKAITHGNGLWIACGDLGVILASSDRTNWVRKITGTSESLRGITFANGIFVAVGDNGTILKSLDGDEWLLQISGSQLSLYSVTVTPGGFIAVGGGLGFGFSVLLRSNDASFWTPESVPRVFGPLGGIAYGAGQVRVVGAQGTALLSFDGKNWAQSTAPTSGNLSAIAFGAGRFVAVGGYRNDQGLLLTSENGGDWQLAIDLPVTWKNAASGIGKFIMVGAGGLLLSNDGINWIFRHDFADQKFNDIIYGNGCFVAVGDLGSIQFSRDGSLWERAFPATAENINALAYGNERFVSVTENGISGSLSCVSTNGSDWTVTSTGQLSSLRAIAFGAGRFVAAGDAGLLLHSTDGGMWNQVLNVNPNIWFYAVAYGNGRFAAAGARQGGILVSDDGSNWLQVATTEVLDLTFSQNWFLALTTSGELLASRNAESWRTCSTNLSADLQHLSYVPGAFLALGRNLIQKSGWIGPPRLTLRRAPSAGLEMLLTGEAGRGYLFEKSPSLSNSEWQEFTSTTNSTELTLLSNLPVHSGTEFFNTRQIDYAQNTMSGRNVLISIASGSGVLSPTGVFRFDVNSSGNGYTLTPISGPIMADYGFCGVTKISSDVNVLTLTNSFGWVIKNHIYFSGPNFGDVESRVLSGPMGSQSGTFILQ